LRDSTCKRGLAILEHVFQKSYEDQYARSIYREFQDTPDDQWDAIIEHFKTSRQAHSLPLIPNFYAARRAVAQIGAFRPHVKVDCKECGGEGLRHYIGKFGKAFPDNVYVRAARCTCPNAQNWAGKIPLVSRIHTEQGFIKIVAPFRLMCEEVRIAEGKPPHLPARKKPRNLQEAAERIGKSVEPISQSELDSERERSDGSSDLPF
jgi:hypothetical protein